MNLLLHGADSPQVVLENALAGRLLDLRDKDRVDVILTNPPFGGEEERGIRAGFPQDRHLPLRRDDKDLVHSIQPSSEGAV